MSMQLNTVCSLAGLLLVNVAEHALTCSAALLPVTSRWRFTY